jgi:hypothetical protein
VDETQENLPEHTEGAIARFFKAEMLGTCVASLDIAASLTPGRRSVVGERLMPNMNELDSDLKRSGKKKKPKSLTVTKGASELTSEEVTRITAKAMKLVRCGESRAMGPFRGTGLPAGMRTGSFDPRPVCSIQLLLLHVAQLGDGRFEAHFRRPGLQPLVRLVLPVPASLIESTASNRRRPGSRSRKTKWHTMPPI